MNTVLIGIFSNFGKTENKFSKNYSPLVMITLLYHQFSGMYWRKFIILYFFSVLYGKINCENHFNKTTSIQFFNVKKFKMTYMRKVNLSAKYTKLLWFVSVTLVWFMCNSYERSRYEKTLPIKNVLFVTKLFIFPGDYFIYSKLYTNFEFRQHIKFYSLFSMILNTVSNSL